jgi:hypothetical protein
MTRHYGMCLDQMVLGTFIDTGKHYDTCNSMGANILVHI